MSGHEPMQTTFGRATAVEAVNSHTYTAHFPEDWCIGSVPHGGFVTATFMKVASRHFTTTLSKQKQPYTIALHLEFLRRTQVGRATFHVTDTKLGQQTSVIQVALIQDDREEVVGYMINSNLHTESGVTFPTNYSLHPRPASVDVSKLQSDTDIHWALESNMPFPEFRKASQKVDFYFPRQGQHDRSMVDEWIRFGNGEKFTNESLGYVADMWPQIGENYRDLSSGKDSKSPFWYPTVVLNLDVKKALPEEGVEWLFARVRAKQIQNGRLDLEVVILDETGDIVALSHHVSFILSASRNLAARRKAGEGEAKL
ncbi:MAG: hypothetical protein M1817_004398 [Caeruleum heppii]|nr:MAG: hypothetical protein M1817_004398 [Caeruleum heppii]